jgi:glutaredoxin-related protein
VVLVVCGGGKWRRWCLVAAMVVAEVALVVVVVVVVAAVHRETKSYKARAFRNWHTFGCKLVQEHIMGGRHFLSNLNQALNLKETPTLRVRD